MIQKTDIRWIEILLFRRKITTTLLGKIEAERELTIFLRTLFDKTNEQ